MSLIRLLCLTLSTFTFASLLSGSPSRAEAPQATATCDPARLWAELQNRHACNRLMGCKAEGQLEQCGSGLASAILARLALPTQRINYGSTRAVVVLGRWGVKEARPTLEGLLNESRWEMRARAALALGELGDTESLAPLTETLRRARKADDRATEAACMWAQMSILGADDAGSMVRWTLNRVTAPSEQELASLNPGYYAFIAELIGEATLSESKKTIHWGAMHRDRYVRFESIGSLLRLQDQDGLPFIASRLEDKSPGVRRLATKAVVRLAGLPATTTTARALAWCKSTDCLAPLRGLATPAPSQRP